MFPKREILRYLIFRVPQSLRYSLTLLYTRLLMVKEAIDDRKNGYSYLPPPKLRFRVHGSADAKSFIRVGQTVAKNIVDALKTKLKIQSLDQFREVLDFGVGCGRVLLFLERFFPETTTFYGCDIDIEAVRYLQNATQRRLIRGNFLVNNPLPPLPFPANKFDLVLSVSVFTHLPEDYQFAWLKELSRITKTGGLLLISVHGSFAQSQNLSETELGIVRRRGFPFYAGHYNRLVGLPSFYQTAYHTRRYI